MTTVDANYGRYRRIDDAGFIVIDAAPCPFIQLRLRAPG